MSDNENTPVAPDVAAHEGGERPAGDVDGAKDTSLADEARTPQDGGPEVPPTRENLRLT